MTFQAADIFVDNRPASLPECNFQGIPGIACTRDGSLWACWYGGGNADEGPGNFIMLASKSPKDDSWSEPWLYVACSQPQARAFDPTVWVDPMGKLWLFWAQVTGKPENNCDAVEGLRSQVPDTRLQWDGIGGVWGICCEQPETAPKQWSSPRRFCDGIMMNKPTLDEQGNWLMPTAIWDLNPYDDNISKAQRGPSVAICSDGGNSAKMMGTADIMDPLFDEHIVLPLLDGRWAMWVRNISAERRALVSYSSDRGQTWTRGVYTDIPCPNSRFNITRLKSGALLLVSHRITQEMIDSKNLWPTRTHLAAWISDDDGQTWNGDLLIDERAHVSYPDVDQAEDGTIHLIYDHTRYVSGDIIHVELTEDQIRKGESEIKRTLISQYTGRGRDTPVDKTSEST